jgi:hypothetical protein
VSPTSKKGNSLLVQCEIMEFIFYVKGCLVPYSMTIRMNTLVSLMCVSLWKINAIGIDGKH